jgi:hypothetical protein
VNSAKLQQSVSYDNDGRLQEVIRGALAAAVRPSPEVATDSSICDLLQEACTIARRDGIRAEHLIILIKESWRRDSAAGELEWHKREHRLADVVTAVVKEYYRNSEAH